MVPEPTKLCGSKSGLEEKKRNQRNPNQMNTNLNPSPNPNPWLGFRERLTQKGETRSNPIITLTLARRGQGRDLHGFFSPKHEPLSCGKDTTVVWEEKAETLGSSAPWCLIGSGWNGHHHGATRQRRALLHLHACSGEGCRGGTTTFSLFSGRHGWLS